MCLRTWQTYKLYDMIAEWATTMATQMDDMFLAVAETIQQHDDYAQSALPGWPTAVQVSTFFNYF